MPTETRLTETDAAPAPTPKPDRAAINRENAQHSTGPRTDPGKQSVRLNAVKHGLYSHTVVLPSEDRAAYESLGGSLLNHLHPHDERQRELVQTIQDSRWFLARAKAVEANLWVLVADQQRPAIDERYAVESDDVRQALAEAAGFQVNFRQFDQLSRARTRVQRALDNATKELNFLQAEAKHSPAAVIAPEPALDAPEPESAAPESETVAGFVSHDHSTDGFVSPQSPAAAATASAPKVKMPKFSGQNAKKDRKQWLRRQAAKVLGA